MKSTERKRPGRVVSEQEPRAAGAFDGLLRAQVSVVLESS